jgi:hypothetical protein
MKLVWLSAGIIFLNAQAFASEITFENKLVDGKKTWLPKMTEVAAGKTTVKIVNTLAEPHGFNMPGVANSLVIQGNETKVLKDVDLKAGKYSVSCQMHPAHVGADVVVK